MTIKDEELALTVDTLIDLDEPEALLATLQRAAAKKKGRRWTALAHALSAAQDELAAELELEAKPEADTPPETA